MSDRPASLLTKTQRRRVENRFDDVEGATRRRDQRRIRRRIGAGLDDAVLLADYPDDQLRETLPADDEAATRRIAGLYVLAERLRLLGDRDRETVAAEMDALTTERSDERSTTLRQVALPTRERVRTAVLADLDDRGPSVWKRRADLLLEASLLPLVPALVLAAMPPAQLPALLNGPVFALLTILAAVPLVAGFALLAVHGLKTDLVPAVRALVRDPTGSLRRAWDRI